MPVFPKPGFPFHFDVASEVRRLVAHRDSPGAGAVPRRTRTALLVASWNIANFGAQQRQPRDLAIIAEIVSWFDLVALQEVREDVRDLEAVRRWLGTGWRLLFSDAAGNSERMAFAFDSRRVELLEEIGEVGFSPDELHRVRLPGLPQRFEASARSPYLATFRAGRMRVTVVNVHLFYGSTARRDLNRRALEAFAVAKWAEERAHSRHRVARDLMAIGDFNMPKRQPSDSVYRALTRRGLVVPERSSRVASSIANDAQYDQVAFLPSTAARRFTGRIGVFDFDAPLFPRLHARGPHALRAWLRYHLSDHRPLWVQLAA